MYKLIVEALSY